jgi:hypothetical protein
LTILEMKGLHVHDRTSPPPENGRACPEVPSERSATAVQTAATVNTDGAAARRTMPPLALVLNKRFQSQVPDALEIRDHAHGVFRSVPLVQLFESLAWIAGALVTESRAVRSDYFTVLDDATHACWGLIGAAVATPGAFVGFPEIGQANAAIHPARRDPPHLSRHHSAHRNFCHADIVPPGRAGFNRPDLNLDC